MMNHKYFILFLFYVVIFCAQIVGPFIKLLFIGSNDPEKESKFGFIQLLANYTNEFIVYMIANALIIGLGFMLVYQIIILLLNKTTLEVSMDPRKNPFRQKGIVRNIEMVFGERKLHWLSPFHEPFPDMKLTGYQPVAVNLSGTSESGPRHIDFI